MTSSSSSSNNSPAPAPATSSLVATVPGFASRLAGHQEDSANVVLASLAIGYRYLSGTTLATMDASIEEAQTLAIFNGTLDGRDDSSKRVWREQYATPAKAGFFLASVPCTLNAPPVWVDLDDEGTPRDFSEQGNMGVSFNKAFTLARRLVKLEDMHLHANDRLSVHQRIAYVATLERLGRAAYNAHAAGKLTANDASRAFHALTMSDGLKAWVRAHYDDATPYKARVAQVAKEAEKARALQEAEERRVAAEATALENARLADLARAEAAALQAAADAAAQASAAASATAAAVTAVTAAAQPDAVEDVAQPRLTPTYHATDAEAIASAQANPGTAAYVIKPNVQAPEAKAPPALEDQVDVSAQQETITCTTRQDARRLFGIIADYAVKSGEDIVDLWREFNEQVTLRVATNKVLRDKLLGESLERERIAARKRHNARRTNGTGAGSLGGELDA